MERRVPAGLTPQEGRRFGLAVGTAFLVLGALLWWRGRPLAFAITGMIGALLVGGGVIIPGQLGPLYRLWMGLAKAISKVTTPILMATIFFLVFLPIGMVMRIMGRRALEREETEGGFWVRRSKAPQSMERQF